MLFCGVWMRQNSLAHFFIFVVFGEVYKDLPNVYIARREPAASSLWGQASVTRKGCSIQN